jgi:hypothetical protein
MVLAFALAFYCAIYVSVWAAGLFLTPAVIAVAIAFINGQLRVNRDEDDDDDDDDNLLAPVA